MAEPTPFKYRAFLSYSHRDKAWGAWLHRTLEFYRVAKDLVGRDTPAGPVPATLRPIFRDREDFSAGSSLTQQTLAALDASQFLIVICSPPAAASPYVNEEIRRFKALGRGDRIISIIVDGEPHDPARECFPLALRVRSGPDDSLTAEHEEPIAADARPQGDGKELAARKVIAGLLALPLDEIVKRASLARKRRQRVLAALAGSFLVLAVVATGSAVYAWQQLKTNEALLDRTLRRATDLVNTAVLQAEHFGVSRALTLRLLQQAEGLFDDIAELGRDTPQLRYRKARMLIEFARNYEILGDTGRQRARALEAQRLLAALVTEKPDDHDFARDLSRANDSVGDVLVAQGNLSEALKAFRASVAIRERLVKVRPDNTGWQRDLVVAYNKVGDALRMQGNLSEALASLRAGLAIIARLSASAPDDTVWQRDLTISHNKIGDVLREQGELPEALTSFRAGLAIMQRLTDSDAGNLGWQLDLTVSHDRIGDVLRLQGNLPDALASYRASLSIAERLAKIDPANMVRQRNLAVAHNKVGDVLRAQGDRTAALTSFRAGLAIMQRLVKADPDNAGWQRDLAVSFNRLGDLLLSQGDFIAALDQFQGALAIGERLVKVDPANAGWQRNVAIGYARLAVIHLRQGNRTEAMAALQRGREIIAALMVRAPEHPAWKRDLAFFDNEIARLERQSLVPAQP